MVRASEKSDLIANKDKPEPWKWTLTFKIDILRFIAIFSIMFLFGSGKLLKRCIFTDIDELFGPQPPEGVRRDLLRGTKDAVVSQISETLGLKDRNLGLKLFGQPFCEPYVEMKNTVIWATFGFEHTCSYIDYNPFAEIFAILIPFYSLPMIGFLLCSLLRAKVLVENGEAQPYLYTYHKWITPFSVAATSVVHLWFVNKPDAVYPEGYGFIAHYIPYVLFQWTLAFIAIGQVHYYIACGTPKMPFGAPIWLAKWYARFFVLLIVVSQTITFSILNGTPILDTVNNEWDRNVFITLADIIAFMILYVPLVLSGYGIWYGESNTITFGGE